MMESRPELISEMEKRFPNQWLAVQVTRVDRNKVPVEGVLLVRSDNRKEVWAQIRGLKADIFVFYTGDVLPEGREALLHGHLSV